MADQSESSSSQAPQQPPRDPPQAPQDSQGPAGQEILQAPPSPTAGLLIGGYPLSNILDQTPIDPMYRSWVQPALWSVTPGADATPEHLVTYLARFLSSYTRQHLVDSDLFYAFSEDFEEWTADMFLRLPVECRRALKTFLRTRGVYTGKNKAQIGHALVRLVRQQEPMTWDNQELEETALVGSTRAYAMRERMRNGLPPVPPLGTMAKEEIFVPSQTPAEAGPSQVGPSRPMTSGQPMTSVERPSTAPRQSPFQQPPPSQYFPQGAPQNMQPRPQFNQRQSLPPPMPPPMQIQPPQQQPIQQETQQQAPQQQWSRQQQSLQPQQSVPPAPSQYGVPPQDRQQSMAWRASPFPAQAPPDAYRPSSGLVMSQAPAEYDPYASLPPLHYDNQRVDPTRYTQFVKTVKNEHKYSGDPYDLLDDKLKQFFNVCYHAEIQPAQFHAVFPAILQRRAETWDFGPTSPQTSKWIKLLTDIQTVLCWETIEYRSPEAMKFCVQKYPMKPRKRKTPAWKTRWIRKAFSRGIMEF